jgi:hypothetical protein
MKIFTSNSVAMVPTDWCRALGMTGSHHQVHVLVVAPDKAAAGRMIADRASSSLAWHLAREIKLRREGDLSTPDKNLLDAGIVSRELPGIFIYRAPVKDSPVAMVLRGSCPIVGYFRLGGGFGSTIYAEKA